MQMSEQSSETELQFRRSGSSQASVQVKVEYSSENGLTQHKDIKIPFNFEGCGLGCQSSNVEIMLDVGRSLA